MYRSLADFLEQLEQAGELKRVPVEVDPALELAELTRRAARADGPALLFQAVRGVDLAVATNVLGSERRICKAMGVATLEAVASRVREFIEGLRPQSWLQRLKLSAPAPADRWQPTVVKIAPCQQVVKLGGDIDLAELPGISSWPQERRPWMIAPVLTQDADAQQRCIGRYDLQVLDRSRLAIWWRPEQRAAMHFESSQRKGDKMPVAISLGSDPALAVATGGPLTEELDSLAFAGMLRDQPLELVKCRTSDLRAPADADLVIEGLIDPAEPPIEMGLAALSSGFYGRSRAGRIVQVTAITHRTNPILPAVIPDTAAGQAGGELACIDAAVQRILLPLVRLAIPEVADFSLPRQGGPNGLGLFAIQKRYAHQARKVASAVWGWTPLMRTKLVLLVDEGVNVHDPGQVWAQALAQIDPARDVFFCDGPLDLEDPSVDTSGQGRRMAIDATTKLAGELAGESPARVTPNEETIRLVERRWREYGF